MGRERKGEWEEGGRGEETDGLKRRGRKMNGLKR